MLKSHNHIQAYVREGGQGHGRSILILLSAAFDATGERAPRLDCCGGSVVRGPGCRPNLGPGVGPYEEKTLSGDRGGAQGLLRVHTGHLTRPRSSRTCRCFVRAFKRVRTKREHRTLRNALTFVRPQNGCTYGRVYGCHHRFMDGSRSRKGLRGACPCMHA